MFKITKHSDNFQPVRPGRLTKDEHMKHFNWYSDDVEHEYGWHVAGFSMENNSYAVLWEWKTN